MKTVLCTLYNSFYLDKGLVLYDSLKDVSSDFSLYVLCMDEKCYKVLNDVNTNSLIPIRLEDVETDELLKVKQTRTFGEYCWTLTPFVISYILEKYNEPICTYIDADMYFYQDPQILVDEMLEANKTVMITPHRFSHDNKKRIKNGIYCVEFNSFVNEKNSLEILGGWMQDCLSFCTSINDGKHFGDQKYLDSWPEKHPDIVHVCQNLGAGIAPWNIEWYKEDKAHNYYVYFNNKRTANPIIFYHYQHITYINRCVIRTSIEDGKDNVDYSMVNRLYTEYLYRIEKKKQMLELKYNIDYLVQEHPANKKRYNWKSWLKQFEIIKWCLKFIRPNKDIYTIYLKRC